MKSRDSTSPPKLLIVEDDRELCRSMERDARALGYSVECAHTLAQTRTRLRSTAGSFPYAIVLLDVMLTDGECTELVPLLREALPPPVIVVISAYLTSTRILELAELGVALCLPKPVEMSELVRRLHTLKSSQQLVASNEVGNQWRLSGREEQVLRCGRTGLSQKETAARLGISKYSVRTYWERILEKTGLDCERRVLIAAGASGRVPPLRALDDATPTPSPSAEMDKSPSRSGVYDRIDVTLSIATPGRDK